MARGLIPAHAGKTRQALYRFDPTAAHPRSRGENAPDQPTIQSTRGSSPLTRGKRRRHPAGPTRRRLIPAHAGKTVGDNLLVCAPWAHPRSRGENATATAQSLLRDGSSPLTRGKLMLVEQSRLLGGLIPAHAGKTRSSSMTCWPAAAHPRSRGENGVPAPRINPALGSSPLTRGKQGTNCDKKSRVRLIPAHAGKTARLDAVPHG